LLAVMQGGEYASPKRCSIFFIAPMTAQNLEAGEIAGGHRPPQQLDHPSRKHVEGFELAVQDCSRSLEPEPAGNHCRVDAAKIGRVDQIVPFVELGQARNLAVMAAFHSLARDEHQVGGSVISSEI